MLIQRQAGATAGQRGKGQHQGRGVKGVGWGEGRRRSRLVRAVEGGCGRQSVHVPRMAHQLPNEGWGWRG